MALKRIIAYKGRKSQTGLATASRFPSLPFEGKKESFDDIAKIISREASLAVLPVWNSHEGEIPKTRVLELVFDMGVNIQEMWPGRIKFECIVKKKNGKKDIESAVSVKVAKTQCSKFLNGLSFVGLDSTTDACDAFRKRDDIDALLCAPGQYIDNTAIKLHNDVANPNNFTTFILLGNVDWPQWNGTKWNSLRRHGLPKQAIMTGVEMPIPYPTLTEEQHELFDNLVKDAHSIDEIPKIVLIFKRGPAKCGMLIESRNMELSTSITDEGYVSDILIKTGFGKTSKEYSNFALIFVKKEFKKSFSHDFIKHLGTQTCLFSCPALNIMTHGFDALVVEQITRRIILKYFELIDKGLACSLIQKRFFNKYKQAYYRKGSDFIDFVQI